MRVARLKKVAWEHFEVLFYGSAWVSASVIAAMVGKTGYAFIGLFTVAPFVAAYVIQALRHPKTGG